MVVRLRVALVVVLLAACAVAAVLVLRGGDDAAAGPLVPAAADDDAPVGDPFAWTAERSDALARRAAAGAAHVLYTRSPGGAVASAERVLRHRAAIERAARDAGVDPDRLEALVLLESAGRQDALAPGGIESAAGLTQILAETATSLLGMRVDLARSRSYTQRLDRALRAGNLRRAAALNRARRRVDDRFDPEKALAGTARYLRLARERFGREDLAFVSYHMGMGNLERVLEAFAGGRRVPYAELFFDSTPLRHRAAWERLSAFGDESSLYYWKLGAAQEIMRLARTDPARLTRVARLQTADASARRVLLDGAPRGGLREVTGDPERTGLRVSGDVRLRPEAFAVALYVAAQVRAISGAAALRVAGADDGGWTLRVSRRYASDAQAQAFQFVLDRLSLLDVIAWSRTEQAIVVTASRDGAQVDGLLRRAG